MNKFRFAVLAAAAFWMSAHPSPLQAATNITIVSGNGQMICGGCSLFAQMTVRVTDQSGAPQIGVAVNWAITSGSFNSVLLSGATTTTDTDGVTKNSLSLGFPLPPGGPFQQFAQNTVSASTGDATATFNLTEALLDPINVQIPPTSLSPLAFLQTLFTGAPLSGQAGSPGSNPLQVRITGSRGTPIPNVSLQLVNLQNPSVGPVVVCRENDGGLGAALSDANGVVSCTPQFGGTPGTGQFFLLIGAGGIPLDDPTQPPFQSFYSSNLNLIVTPATPGSIKIISGNSQSGNPGQALSAFQVEVDGTSGNPISGAQVRWSVTPAGAVNFPTFDTITDVNGRSSNTGTLSGIASGTIQVTATVVADTTKRAVFTVTAIPLVTVTSFAMVSGNNQSAPAGTAFGQPLVVQVTTSSGSAANLPVQFQVSSGSLSLSNTAVNTDSNGRAQVSVTAGSVTGAATVTASISSNAGSGTLVFQLTVLQPAPNITSGSFVNGADQQANSLSPCSLGAILSPVGALGIPNASSTFPGQPVANSTARVTFNNVGAPILQISTTPNGQQQAITFQVPCETAPGAAVPVSVNVGGGTTNLAVAVQAASPGIFQTLGSDGLLRAVVVRPDGSFASLTNPVRKGENVSMFVTGMGATSPAIGTYSLPVPGGAPANVSGTVVVGMAGGGVPVVSARLTEDLPGVYLVTFQVPTDVTAGSNVSISVAVIPVGSGTPIYSATTKIPVQ